MIKFILINNEVVKFNLKNFDREKSLRNAWYAMSDMENAREKKLKITTNKGTTLYKIKDIKNCVFDESILVQGNLNTNPKR